MKPGMQRLQERRILMRNLLRTAALLAGALLIASAGRLPAATVVVDWDRAAIEVALQVAPDPTNSTHLLAAVHSCMYEAWAAYDPVAMGLVTGNSLDGLGGAPTDANKAESISHAAYTTFDTLFPFYAGTARALMRAKGYSPEDDTAPARLGRQAAMAVIEARFADDGTNWQNDYADTSGYELPDPSLPDTWEPIVVSDRLQEPTTPHWGGVRPFALERGDQFRPPPPPAPGSPEWDRQIAEVIAFGAGLNHVNKAIVEYWLPEEGTPATLHSEQCQWISRERGHGIDEDMRMFFLAHNAMYDAGIVAWEAKYHYNYVRPIKAVRALGDTMIRGWGGPGEGIVEMKASDWQTYHPVKKPSPPFPEYVSGHSTFGGAWAEAMTRLTGSAEFGLTAVVDHLSIEGVLLPEPVMLPYPTFWSAAYDSGISRLHGGVHFMQGNVQGLAAGELVGALAHKKADGLYRGHAHCPEESFLGLRAPIGLTSVSLIGGTTILEDGELDGLAAIDARRGNAALLGTEPGDWMIEADDRGRLHGIAVMTIVDGEGGVVRRVELAVRGRTRFTARGAAPGAATFRNRLVMRANGRADGQAHAVGINVLQAFDGDMRDTADLVAMPGARPSDGWLTVRAGNLVRRRERVRVVGLAPELVALQAKELEPAGPRGMLWRGVAHMSDPDHHEAEGTWRVTLRPAATARRGTAVAQVRAGAARVTAWGSHAMSREALAAMQEIDGVVADRLFVRSPGGFTLVTLDAP